MAKSKGKIELQVEIKTQEQWDELLSKEGLIVVDSYSAWCGPCKAIVSSFKRLKNELGDDLLVFATAETDSIDSLEAYRMKSQPTFLFYAGGILVNAVRGCNCPLLVKTIRNELEKEHKVLDGKGERVPFVDQEALKEPVFDEKKDEEKELEEEEEELVELPKQVTLAVIKPDAVKAGLVDEIIQKVEESGMEVLKKEEKILSKEEAAEFYKQHEGSEHFDQLVEFMSSGPCMTLLLSKAGDSPDVGDGTIEYFRDLIGPKDVNIAKEEAPTSLRALYGTDTVMNAVHGCDSAESAARELAFFYPDFVAPTVIQKRKKKRLQRTLALIRPDALRTRRESILGKIQEAGFTIAMSKEITLSRDQAEAFYSEHKDADFFETLVGNMTSGPMMALCLAREDAVEGWREMLGPKEVSVAAEEAPDRPIKELTTVSSAFQLLNFDGLRHQFQVEESPINPLHGSDSPEMAEKEIQQFFPVQSTVAVIKPDLEPDKREEVVQRIKEAGFKIQFEKEVTLTKDVASQFYQEHEGKDFFEGLTDFMASGPTLFMVLTREDAVTGWRALMGPTDPQQALELAPNSLRAQFGVDTMKNAVHGSSTVEKAEEVIKEFFPEVEILPDGTVKVPKVEGESETIEEAEPVAKEEIKQQPDDTFSEPLGMENGSIPSEAIKASSELDDQHSASRARLNTKPEGELMGAWVPLQSDENQWLQVDLGKVTRLVKIASQGEAGDSSRHVKEFSVSYSLHGEQYIPYREDSTEKVFESNSDQDTVIYNRLKNPVITQFIRLNPKTWNEAIAIRTEFYGCNADSYSEALGVENGSIPSEAIKASSELDDQHSASRARLNTKPEGELMGAWVPLQSDENQWLQVDLGNVSEITKVCTQGGGDGVEHRVSSYIMLFSEDGENFQEYQENNETKVFEGNSDGDTVVSHWLLQPVRACSCRLQPKTWNEQIALRLELYGKLASDEIQDNLQSEKTDENTQDAAENVQDMSDQPKEEDVQQEAPLEDVDVSAEELPNKDADVSTQEVPNKDADVSTEEVPIKDADVSTEEVSNKDSDVTSPQEEDNVNQQEAADKPENEGEQEEDTPAGRKDDVESQQQEKEEEVLADKQQESNENGEGTPEDGQVSEEVKEGASDESKPEEGQKTEEENHSEETPKPEGGDGAAVDENAGQVENESNSGEDSKPISDGGS